MLSRGQSVDQTYHVEKGSTAEIPCNVNTAYDYPSWSGPPVSEVGTPKLYNMVGSSAFFTSVVNRDRMSWGTNKRNLVLSDVAIADEGTYICATREAGAWAVQLIVRGVY